MNIPDVIDAWRAYIAAQITQIDPAAPDRSFMYHLKPPDDCCTEAGTLGVWWQTLDYSTGGLARDALNKPGAAGGAFQLVDLGARFASCWFVPDVQDLTAAATVARWNGDAARLALIADHVDLALIRLSCGAATLGDGVFCDGARWTSTRPDISGDCAGIEWHLVAGLSGDTDTS